MSRARLTLAAARVVVRQCESKGLSWMESQGYEWLRNKFQPAISSLKGVGNASDRKLLGRMLKRVGDLFFVHGAPLAAIRTYRQSFKFLTADGESLREVGDLLLLTGDLPTAKLYYKRALSTNAADESSLRSVQYLDEIEGAQSSFEPCYVQGDIAWKVSELLTQSRAKSALSSLARPSSIRVRLLRAMAYGA